MQGPSMIIPPTAAHDYTHSSSDDDDDNDEIVFPLRRAFPVDHEFFAWGDAQRAHSSKFGLVAARSQRLETAEEVDLQVDGERFDCGVKGCTKTFAALKEFEAHYRAAHQFQCNQCSKTCLSARLLDIHISEMHDSFFRAMAERRPMYVCLAEGCPEVFRNADARQRHLVCDHHYPKTYDFHRPFRSRDKQRSKTKGRARKPCAFYNTRKGCRNGENCPFSHEVAGSASGTAASVEAESKEHPTSVPMDTPDEVDKLAAALEATHIRVPEEIAFGRKGGGRSRRMR